MSLSKIDELAIIERRKRVLEHGVRRASAIKAGIGLAEEVRADRGKHYADPEVAARKVKLAKILLEGGRITEDEFIFFVALPVENVHEGPHIEDRYPELKPLSAEMRAIERAEGLEEDEYWYIPDSPPGYQALNEQYMECLARRFAEQLHNFGLPDVARMWLTDRQRFDEMRERGRRSVFDSDNSVAAVFQSIQTYEDEAELCGNAGAYYAACVMLGSATEARLLFMCLTNPAEVQKFLSQLTRKSLPKNNDPLHWSLEHLINIADGCGWLKAIEDEMIMIDVTSYLVRLKSIRNLLHAGRHARDNPHVNIGMEAYTDALRAYDALVCCLDETSEFTPLPDTDDI